MAPIRNVQKAGARGPAQRRMRGRNRAARLLGGVFAFGDFKTGDDPTVLDNHLGPGEFAQLLPAAAKRQAGAFRFGLKDVFEASAERAAGRGLLDVERIAGLEAGGETSISPCRLEINVPPLKSNLYVTVMSIGIGCDAGAA